MTNKPTKRTYPMWVNISSLVALLIMLTGVGFAFFLMPLGGVMFFGGWLWLIFTGRFANKLGKDV